MMGHARRPNWSDIEPSATESALRQERISQRCEIIGGDFFKGVPAGADVYLLKGIIHDWNDEAALKIPEKLSACDPIRMAGCWS
jgi:hypothetical protein